MNDASNPMFKDVKEFMKDVWGVVAAISAVGGPGGTLFLPTVPAYSRSSALWAFSLSLFGLLFVYKQFWAGARHVSCWWSFAPVCAAILFGGLYAYLFDFLPNTALPRLHSTLSQHILSVTYALPFTSLTMSLGLVRVCRAQSRGTTSAQQPTSHGKP